MNAPKDNAMECLLDLREAETVFLNLTQAMIVEKIDMEFCLEIADKVDDGMEKLDALKETVKAHGFHFRND